MTQRVCQDQRKAVAADRYAFFSGFFQNFYNTDQFLGKRGQRTKPGDSGQLERRGGRLLPPPASHAAGRSLARRLSPGPARILMCPRW